MRGSSDSRHRKQDVFGRNDFNAAHQMRCKRTRLKKRGKDSSFFVVQTHHRRRMLLEFELPVDMHEI